MKNEGIERMEKSQEILKAVIDDLTSAYNALNEYISILKDPIEMLTNFHVSEDLEKLVNKSQLYFLMAGNKLDAYGAMVDGDSDDEEEE